LTATEMMMLFTKNRPNPGTDSTALKFFRPSPANAPFTITTSGNKYGMIRIVPMTCSTTLAVRLRMSNIASRTLSVAPGPLQDHGHDQRDDQQDDRQRGAVPDVVERDCLPVDVGAEELGRVVRPADRDEVRDV